MSYANEILEALHGVPEDIKTVCLMDINRRISDWMASGGKENDPYIYQQVRFAKNVAKMFGIKPTHD